MEKERKREKKCSWLELNSASLGCKDTVDFTSLGTCVRPLRVTYGFFPTRFNVTPVARTNHKLPTYAHDAMHGRSKRSEINCSYSEAS